MGGQTFVGNALRGVPYSHDRGRSFRAIAVPLGSDREVVENGMDFDPGVEARGAGFQGVGQVWSMIIGAAVLASAIGAVVGLFIHH